MCDVSSLSSGLRRSICPTGGAWVIEVKTHTYRDLTVPRESRVNASSEWVRSLLGPEVPGGNGPVQQQQQVPQGLPTKCQETLVAGFGSATTPAQQYHYTQCCLETDSVNCSFAEVYFLTVVYSTRVSKCKWGLLSRCACS